MKSPILYTCFLLLVLQSACLAGETAEVSLYFSPHGGIESTIINAINEADDSIFMASYTFSNKRIATALYRAAKRGVTVRVLLDRRQPTAHYSLVDDLLDHGLTVRIDRRESLMHMKLIILDGKTIICGSYNHTVSAENRNAEIVTIIVSEKLAAIAAADLLKHWTHSVIHTQPGQVIKSVKNISSLNDCTEGFCPSKPITTNYRFKARRTRKWSNSLAPCSRSRLRERLGKLSSIRSGKVARTPGNW